MSVQFKEAKFNFYKITIALYFTVLLCMYYSNYVLILNLYFSCDVNA